MTDRGPKPASVALTREQYEQLLSNHDERDALRAEVAQLNRWLDVAQAKVVELSAELLEKAEENDD